MKIIDQTLRLIDNAQDQAVGALTGHHENCPRYFSFGICGCDCDHKGQRKWIPKPQ